MQAPSPPEGRREWVNKEMVHTHTHTDTHWLKSWEEGSGVGGRESTHKEVPTKFVAWEETQRRERENKHNNKHVYWRGRGCAKRSRLLVVKRKSGTHAWCLSLPLPFFLSSPPPKKKMTTSVSFLCASLSLSLSPQCLWEVRWPRGREGENERVSSHTGRSSQKKKGGGEGGRGKKTERKKRKHIRVTHGSTTVIGKHIFCIFFTPLRSIKSKNPKTKLLQQAATCRNGEEIGRKAYS